MYEPKWQATIKGTAEDAVKALERRGIAYSRIALAETDPQFGPVVLAEVAGGYQPDLALWFSERSPLTAGVGYRPGTLLTFGKLEV